MVYVRGSIPVQAHTLVWVDREGREERIDAPPRAYTSPRISPDGSKIALNARDEELDIWIWDVERKNLTRLTFNPGQDRFPVWSPDGTRIAYSYQEVGGTDVLGTDLLWQAADGTGAAERLVEGSGQIFPTSFVPDGSGILVYGAGSGADSDDNINLVPLAEQSQPVPLLGTSFGEAMPELSPSGDWLAYVSDESGSEEIYVRPFPNTDAGRWQVSVGGGTEPLWGRDGRELYYRNQRDGGTLWVVPVQTDPIFSAGTPRVVFQGRYLSGPGGRAYDISADGERFLMIKPAEAPPQMSQIIIVENWLDELKRLVPTE